MSEGDVEDEGSAARPTSLSKEMVSAAASDWWHCFKQ